MENEFVTYELALRMKQLGFDEPCFNFYMGGFKELGKIKYVNPNNVAETNVLAPTFSQAFRWFRDKLKDSALEPYDMVKHYAYNMKVSWEEAEIACLEKLIEIVEQKEK
jgi:hypothetical protein